MPDDRSRVDTVPLIAGSAVLDLVNTVSWRGDAARSDDHLRGTEECLRWARRAEVITAGEDEAVRALLRAEPRRDDLLLDGLRELRDLVAATIHADVGRSLGEPAKAAMVDAFAHAELVAPDGSRDDAARAWVIRLVDEHTIRRRLALQLESLLTADRVRIGVCGDPDCQWVFLDTSRARSRRWCSSADCGNRLRVRRHQQRQSRSGAR